MNMLDATIDERGAVFGSLVVPLTAAQRAAATSADVIVGVRPEALRVATTAGGLSATVVTVEELGSDSYLYCTADSHAHQTIVARAEGLSSVRPGETVTPRPRHHLRARVRRGHGARLPD